MKYKVGDRVRIKEIREGRNWCKSFRAKFQKIDTPYVVTITEVNCNEEGEYSYLMKELPDNMVWYNEIESLYEEPTYEPIKNRWEILDL